MVQWGMGTFLYLIASLLLSVSPSVGFTPLKTTAKLTLDPRFTAGTVCLIWESEDDSATPGSDCWTIENSRQRTWNKDLHLRAGDYRVWVTTVGQDEKGNAMSMASPPRVVQVRAY